ncbi:MAG: hypothetical protein KKF65_07855, partial [Nanoarchaeota archaeon]|nr:hypothetical protein [Nanoarchaeota archaeon]
MKVEDQQLQAFLLDAGLVKKNVLKETTKEAKKAGKRLADLLITKGLLSEEEVIKMQAYILGIPFVNLEKE